jgi:hypothetical protein
MKTMNKEAKEALVEVVQKMNKEAASKKKQADDLMASAKILEETAQKLNKEIDNIQVQEDGTI